MFKKYVILAVCLALAVTLIHAPDSWGKVRAAKSFDGKVWVRIDEVEGHPWGETATYPGNREHGNQWFFFIYIPFFDVSSGLMCIANNNPSNAAKTLTGRVGEIERVYNNKWRPGSNRRVD